MGFESIKKLVDDCYEQGQHWYTGFRYAPSIASAAGLFFDLSQSPGTPYPNLYNGTPYTANAFPAGSGIWHGGNVAPLEKRLHKLSVSSVSAGVVPARLILCDFLLYYPYIDISTAGPQNLFNPITLPRYTDGLGVYMFLVSMGAYTGAGSVWVGYTNSANVTTNKTGITTLATTNVQGTIVHSGAAAGRSGAFMQIQRCKGVKYATDIEFSSVSVGMFALVLARPLAEIKIREIGASCEVDFLLNKNELPRIYDGAHLNFLIDPNGSMASTQIIGDMTVIWG
jgi:hypothetical protein